MLPYASFDDAWGAPLAPPILNPYKDTEAIAEEQRAQRSDVDVCREVLSRTMETQGCIGVRRLMGPSMCAQLDMHAKQAAKRRHRMAISQDDLMMLLLLGILLLLFLRS